MPNLICIDERHPSLAGHFPGHPVVPGVVLLGEIIDCCRRHIGAGLHLTGVPMVKFKSPLLPGQQCQVRFDERGDGKIGFSCVRDQEEIASGILHFTAGNSNEVT